MKKKNIVIIGAAGRDFHNFNVCYRNNPDVNVCTFTAAQIPDIAGRIYPPALSGSLYPNGIPILDEKDLEQIIKEKQIDECILSYSDLSYQQVMRIGSRVISSGSTFSLLGAHQTMLQSSVPVIAVLAVRTGCGKSQTTRAIVRLLKNMGKKVVSIRHPMPYGNLEDQICQRYATIEDLSKYNCTIEEMEEYEPHIAMGSVIYAGVDYEKILREAEKEADIIIWDGGNNDTSFYKPNLTVVVADPLRAGHEVSYYPGEVNLRLADVIIINKIDSASSDQITTVLNNIKLANPTAHTIKAESTVTVDNPDVIKNKRVLVIEDGPTLTHGEMKIGAGTVAVERNHALQLVDPRPWVVGEIAKTYEKYPNIGKLLPAMGYGKKQMQDLEETINKVECDGIVIGTPINLARFIKINKPYTRVKYELSHDAEERLKTILVKLVKKLM